MTDMPLVSIIIDNYNYGHLIAETIDSALAQTYPNIEVIVVDDGSTDNSREVIARYGDRVIPVFKENGGQCSAFNVGFAASHGDIIALLDSDDVWDPEKIALMVDIFQRYPEVGWVGHKLTITDAKLNSLGYTFPDLLPNGPVPPDPHLHLERMVRVTVSGLLFRRSAGERAFPIPYESGTWRTCADVYLMSMFAIEGIWGYTLDESLGLYRQHPGQEFAQPGAIARRVERDAVISEALAEIWTRRKGRRFSSTTVYKHRLVASALTGHAILSGERWRLLAGGIRSVVDLVRPHPRLAVRQGLGIAIAFAFPHWWTRRVFRRFGTQFTPQPAATS
ncbi:glycosyltransferase [Sphaerobacter sp.]|uniref:glycosyltransferase family 2 protein n=1 Tax=Sphaerobacter sp. TaxID=2099654 RepID=UPI001D6ABEE6|nr:glycosyltransferase [Sphaerobacter sp.]MBX5445313.1 glycosyltransferase [Sphaerobacter sp.]